MNQPCNVPIEFYQGETFAPPPITWIDQNGDPIDITGYQATLTARNTVNANDPPYLQASTTNGMITVLGTQGLQIVIGALVTATLVVPFNGVWDLFVYSPQGYATRLVGGSICVKEAVTRP